MNDGLFVKYSHSDLVAAARTWLRKTRCCAVVVSEIATLASESPDAIGWRWQQSHLVECKTSRSDFLADRKKMFRMFPEFGVGDYRWYFTLPNVIRDEGEFTRRLWLG